MKYIVIYTIVFGLLFQALQAKGSLKTNEAFEKYRKNETYHKKNDIVPGPALSELLKKQNSLASPEDVLDVLAGIRDSPAKEFIPSLKELWKVYQKNTFKAREPKYWRSIKTEDYSQMLCDEIKAIIKSIGGDVAELDAIDKLLVTADTGDPLEMIKKLDPNDDSDTFTRCLIAIDRDWTLSRESRTQLRVKFLVIVNAYLKANSNLAGSDVETGSYPFIYNSTEVRPVPQDPASRADHERFEKMIADNAALPKPQQKYNGLIRCRQAILSPLVSEIQRHPEYIKEINYFIKTQTKNAIEAKELRVLIDQTAIKREISPPVWEDLQNQDK